MVRIRLAVLALIALAAVVVAPPVAADDPVPVDLAVTSNSVTPTSTQPRGEIEYAFTASRLSGGDAHEVVVTAQLPAGATITGLNPLGGGVCDYVGTTVTCTSTRWGPDTAQGVAVRVYARAPFESGSHDMVVTVSSDDPESNPADNAAGLAQALEVGEGSADLMIDYPSWGNTPWFVVVGEPMQVRYVVRNNGPGWQEHPSISVTIPGDAVLESVTTSDAAADCASSTGTVTCTWPEVMPGWSSEVLLDILAPTSPGSYNSSAAVSGAVSDPNPANNSGAPPYPKLVVVNEADLGVNLYATPEPAGLGRPVAYQVQVIDYGPAYEPPGRVITLDLPEGSTYVSATGAACSLDGHTVTCTNPTWPWVVVQAIPPALGAFEATASIASSRPDPNPSNNVASLTTTVVPDEADLQAWLVDEHDPVAVGGEIAFRMSASNGGEIDTTGTLIFTPPAGTTVTGVERETFDGWSFVWVPTTCPMNGADLVCTSFIPHGTSSANYRVRVTTPDSPALLSASLTVSGDVTDPDLSDNTAVEQTAVLGPTADLDVTNSFAVGDPIHVVGEPIEYAVNVYNHGPADATAPELVLTMPTGATYLGSEYATCAEAAGEVRCDLAPLPANSGRGLTVRLTAPSTPGSYTTELAVQSLNDDTQPANNTLSIPTEVTADQADVAVWVGSIQEWAPAGQLHPFIVRLSNEGPAVTGTSLTLSSPNGTISSVQLVPDSGATVELECGAPATSVVCDSGMVAPSTLPTDDKRLFVWVQSQGGGAATELTLEVSATGVRPDPDPSDNNSSATVQVASLVGMLGDTSPTPVSGVKVKVWTSTGTYVGSTVSNAEGTFAFRWLPEGQYKVGFVDPSKAHLTEYWQDARTLATSSVVTVGGPMLTWLYPVLDRPSNLQGKVEVRSNLGVDPAVGTRVTLYRSDGTSAGTDVTRPDGSYSFSGLRPDTYRIKAALPTTPGTLTLPIYYSNQFTMASATPVPVPVGGGVSVPGQNILVEGALSGVVTDDQTGAPLGAIRVTVSTGAGKVVGSVTTAVDGSYRVVNLPTGTYRLRFSDLGGRGYTAEYWQDAKTVATATAIDYPARSDLVADAELFRPATVHGTVTADGSPLARATVHLLTSDGTPVATATTNAAGGYVLKGVRAGTYLLRFAKAGYPDIWWYQQTSLARAQPLDVPVGFSVTADASLR